MRKRLATPVEAAGNELAAAYGHLDIFRDVDFDSIAHLLIRCKTLELAQDEVVLMEGNANTAVYQMLRGCLQVRFDGIADAPLVTLEAGACVGELSILSRLDVSATVVALEPSRLLVIHDPILWALVHRCHAFAANLLGVLSARVRDTSERRRTSLLAQQQSARAARLDPLTGLYNRRWLDETLLLELRRCQAEEQPMSVLLIDIDHFEPINDEHGHLVGDEVLRIIAARLRHTLRAPALAARYGGEEFIVLLPGVSAAQACDVAVRLRRQVAATRVQAGAIRLAVTVSAGVAAASPAMRPRALLNDAEAALHLAKRGGGNRVSLAGTGGAPPTT